MNIDNLKYKGNKTAFIKELEEFCKKNNMQNPSKEQRENVWHQLQNMSNAFNFDFKKACELSKIQHL